MAAPARAVPGAAGMATGLPSSRWMASAICRTVSSLHKGSHASPREAEDSGEPLNLPTTFGGVARRASNSTDFSCDSIRGRFSSTTRI
jgi:hypothetical protein